MPPAPITALVSGDVHGDDSEELIAGCEDGTVLCVTARGDELWRSTLPAKVNAIATVDLDDDGKLEVACGVEDEHLHVLNPDGTERWKRFFEAYRASGGREGHVRVVTAADFDGDGIPEIACGGANASFFVVDAEGHTKQSEGQDWVVRVKHSASAIAAADVTGDGRPELLGGYTYFGRALIDFTDTGRSRVSNLGGCISGCEAVTAADVDGDGI